MKRYQECGLPCVRDGCEKYCAWVPTHNTDDGLHLCWKHVKEWEEELEEDDYRGMDHD